MKTVQDDDGKRYVLVKRSDEASLVRDPATGNECYVGNDRLELLEGVSPLETAAAGVSEPVRRVLGTVHDDQSLGLLLELADHGPRSIRTILSATDFCESDLHGRLATWLAADLLAEATVHGERGYQVTEDCERAMAVLREFDSEEADPDAQSSDVGRTDTTDETSESG